MDLHEIARRTTALPARYTDRLDTATADQLRDTAEAGETAELLDLLIAALHANKAAITTAERNELADLLTACRMPTTDLERLRTAGKEGC